jgi:hypothetical protein
MKMIINNKSDLSDVTCLYYVGKFIEMSRISANGNQYSYASGFTINEKEYVIYSNLNKKSDVFTIINHK